MREEGQAEEGQRDPLPVQDMKRTPLSLPSGKRDKKRTGKVDACGGTGKHLSHTSGVQSARSCTSERGCDSRQSESGPLLATCHAMSGPLSEKKNTGRHLSHVSGVLAVAAGQHHPAQGLATAKRGALSRLRHGGFIPPCS